MSYYIKYPNNRTKKVSVVTSKPKRAGKTWGFAEGPLKTKADVTRRLNMMGVHKNQRPSGY